MLKTLFSTSIATNYVWLTLITFTSWTGGAGSVTMTSHFQIFQNKSPVAPAVIESAEVVSLVDCASMCSANVLCKSFFVNCFELSSAKQICHQQNTSVSSDLELVASDMCYVQRADLFGMPATTTAASTTTVATSATTTTTASSTTASGTPVIDIVYGPKDMCPAGSTSQDFLVLTPGGVYVYDEIDDLTSAPCDGPKAFTSIFKDYPSMPAIDMVSGILIYQTSNVELYAGNITVFVFLLFLIFF
ncbi:uncharacterized protein LOC128548452 [Mercenaria mercenaria]|uniref:uncharacterized protein LOC128548452 n=1 Tax=Mercenaria mercenaria TaxID=6596 RepID=UPI00234EAC6E|nr:uncharacterized protein LOC128548452 [Mercenaria mercenaria]